MIDNWNVLTELDDWNSVIEKSKGSPMIIFKHSTRCSISSVAWRRFNDKLYKFQNLSSDGLNYVDVISNRELSNTIASELNVRHESPQLLLILNGKCVYNVSHMSISVDSVKDFIQEMSPKLNVR